MWRRDQICQVDSDVFYSINLHGLWGLHMISATIMLLWLHISLLRFIAYCTPLGPGRIRSHLSCSCSHCVPYTCQAIDSSASLLPSHVVAHGDFILVSWCCLHLICSSYFAAVYCYRLNDWTDLMFSVSEHFSLAGGMLVAAIRCCTWVGPTSAWSIPTIAKRKGKEK